MPVEATLPATFFMSHGARNWPFLMLTGFPVLPAAIIRSVWRHRKAGVWMISTTSATGAHCSGVWMSVKIGSPVFSLISARMGNPASSPIPRAPPIDERFALSNDVL